MSPFLLIRRNTFSTLILLGWRLTIPRRAPFSYWASLQVPPAWHLWPINRRIDRWCGINPRRTTQLPLPGLLSNKRPLAENANLAGDSAKPIVADNSLDVFPRCAPGNLNVCSPNCPEALEPTQFINTKMVIHTASNEVATPNAISKK